MGFLLVAYYLCYLLLLYFLLLSFVGCRLLVLLLICWKYLLMVDVCCWLLVVAVGGYCWFLVVGCWLMISGSGFLYSLFSSWKQGENANFGLRAFSPRDKRWSETWVSFSAQFQLVLNRTKPIPSFWRRKFKLPLPECFHWKRAAQICFLS